MGAKIETMLLQKSLAEVLEALDGRCLLSLLVMFLFSFRHLRTPDDSGLALPKQLSFDGPPLTLPLPWHSPLLSLHRHAWQSMLLEVGRIDASVQLRY